MKTLIFPEFLDKSHDDTTAVIFVSEHLTYNHKSLIPMLKNLVFIPIKQFTND